jgi:hypothetical protein
MGIRFRKSFKLAPGVRMNFSGSGISTSFGPRGASVSIGKLGVYGNVGIPGAGLSIRSKLSGGNAPARRSFPAPQPQTVQVSAKVGVTDDGELFFQDANDNPLPPHWVEAAKKQNADAIKGLIQRKCDEINAQIDAVGDLHVQTPDPAQRPVFVAREYGEPPPVKPVARKPTFFQKLFASKRAMIDVEKGAATIRHQEQVMAWKARFEEHRRAEAKRRRHIEEMIYSDLEAMESHLKETLQDIAWPRETSVAAELLDSGRRAFIDVDLPEIEDMPDKTAGVPQRGMKLSVKAMSPTQVQRLYMRHIHSIAFRIIGETFTALPEIQQVVLSGYSQRRDKVTGRINDEYLYSVRVARPEWRGIDFSHRGLRSLDVTEALWQFELRRNMSKTGVFKSVIPFTMEDKA